MASADLLEAAFFLCSYELSIKSVHSPWCFLFSETDAKVRSPSLALLGRSRPFSFLKISLEIFANEKKKLKHNLWKHLIE